MSAAMLCSGRSSERPIKIKSPGTEAMTVSESNGKINKRSKISYSRLHASIEKIQRVGYRSDQKEGNSMPAKRAEKGAHQRPEVQRESPGNRTCHTEARGRYRNK